MPKFCFSITFISLSVIIVMSTLPFHDIPEDIKPFLIKHDHDNDLFLSLEELTSAIHEIFKGVSKNLSFYQIVLRKLIN